MQLPRSPTMLALLASALMVAALGVHGPIAQPEHYHAFADQRSGWRIDHCANVLSNLTFLLAAAYGAWRIRHSAMAGAQRTGLVMFVAALALTALGSTWYHLAPDDARLVWDRLPIALACASLLGTVLASRTALLLLGAGAVASVAWWSVSGDLRPYLLLQLAPLVLIPLLQWQAGAPGAQRKAVGVAVGLYVLAKVCELADLAIYQLLGALSGHTLKHVLAAAACAWLVHGLASGPRTPLAVS